MGDNLSLEIHFPVRDRLLASLGLFGEQAEAPHTLELGRFFQDKNLILTFRRSDHLWLRIIWLIGEAAQKFTIGRKLFYFDRRFILRNVIDYPNGAAASQSRVFRFDQRGPRERCPSISTIDQELSILDLHAEMSGFKYFCKSVWPFQHRVEHFSRQIAAHDGVSLA